MATQLTFRRGTSEPTQASGLTLGEPAFNTALSTFHIGRGAGITAAWIGAQISGLSTGIAAGLTLQVPTMSAVKDYVASTTSGVATLNSLTGTVTLAAGTNIGVTTAGSSITVTNLGVQTFNGLTGAVQGVSAAAAGDGIAVSGATGAVTITNTGVTRAVAGTGISVSGATGSVTITNIGVQSFNGNTGAVTGVSAAVAGTGISVSGATGAVTITNIGVQSFNGATGAVTGASLGANTFTGLNTFNAGITTSFLYASTGSTFASTLQVNGGATFAATANFTVGLTSSGSIQFRGTDQKSIRSTQATILIQGVTSGSVSTYNSVTLPVDGSPLVLGSVTENVNIQSNHLTPGAVPGLRIVTDDTIGGIYGTVIKPGAAASAERTQTLQDASGVIALTSQLMGAINGSTAATTAVTSFNGLTGAVGGVTTSVANTFTAAQTFNSGLTASTLDVSGAARTTGDVTVGATLTVNGNFQVYGTLTTVNRTDLNIDDKTITMGRTLASDALADGGGLSLSGTAARTWTWSNTRSAWESNQGVNVASTYGYAVNGTSVLTSSTLGSGVTGSSLTAVGTLATGVWQATAIGATYGGTGLTSYTIGDVIYASGTGSLSKLGATTAGYLLSANGAGAAPEYKQVLIKDAAANSIATITSGSGTLTATIQNATASLKGVASFDNTNFTVSSGAVTITGVDGGTY